MNESVVRLPSDRALEVLEGGDLAGLPVFMQHGGNVSRQLYPPLVVYAQSHGIRLISYNRPGYGGSTPHPGRTIADAAADVAVIADRLGLERFGVWGISAGGDPALACAALLPRRVVAAASLAGLAPHPAEGLDWFAGMGEANAAAFRLQLSNPREWEARQRTFGANLAHAQPTQLRESLKTLLSDADRSVLTDEFAGYLAACSHEAFRLGTDGTVEDFLAQFSPWGFDLASIRVPIQIWHGRQDQFVPVSHGAWLGARIPGAEVRLEENEGHFSLLVRRIQDIHQWLASKF